MNADRKLERPPGARQLARLRVPVEARPGRKLTRTIRGYRASIEATIEWRLTNGIAESNNASIDRIRTNARGFHTAEAFITMIMLDRAGIAPQLPWTTAG